MSGSNCCRVSRECRVSEKKTKRLPKMDATFDSEHAKGPEAFENVSGSAVGAGLILLLGIAILGLVLWFGNGRDKDGRRDRFQYSARVSDVTADFQLSWSPRNRAFPRRHRSIPNDDDKGKSPIYRIVWGFLGVWLAMSAVFLIFAGVVEQIEVFRARAHLFASLFILVALVLCASWTLLFRIGTLTREEKERNILQFEEFVRAELKDPDRYLAALEMRMPDWNATRRPFLQVSAFVLGLAWLCAAFAAALVSAWTLPGEQYGMLLFFGPGYGLFVGWLLFAFSLSTGTAIAAQSHPEGIKTPPESTRKNDNIEYVYPTSYLPVFFSTIGGMMSIVSLDPAQPIPSLIAFVVFTPMSYRPNQISTIICVLSTAASAALVWLRRSGGL